MSSDRHSSTRHRERGGHRSRSRSKSPYKSSRAPSIREEWRSVRVKDEPLSDMEGGGGGKGRHSAGRRDRDDYDQRRDSRRSSPPPRPQSTSRDADRGGGSRDHHTRNARDRDHGGDKNERPRPKIKSEFRSRSRSRSPAGEFVRPPQRHQNQHHAGRNEHDRDRQRGGDHERDRDRRQSPPQRDAKRERDWDNFFNPESDMSRQAVVKREQRANDEKEQQVEEFDKDGNKKENIEKEKPNFGLSGKLTEETNLYRGVVIKYSEPPEARKPLKTRWRLYPFKDNEPLEVMYIHRQSAYLLGRERKIADIPIDHPSCSKQHAVIQYRLVPYVKPNGLKGRRIRPYIIDLESANGTLVNGKKIDPKRYVELFEKDVLKFGFSSREYVLLHEHSQDDDPLDDDGYDNSPSPE